MPMSSMNLLPSSSGSVFNINVAGSSEMLATVSQTIWRHIPENRNLSFDSCENTKCYKIYVGTAVAQWLRCCATNRKVAGSIPADAIGIFHRHKILRIVLWPWGRLSL